MPVSGYPGVKSVAYTVSGAHPYVVSAAFPWELNSETARDKEVKETRQVGWIPNAGTDNLDASYFHYTDFLILPHQTVQARFVHNPSYDEFAIGLSREAGIWNTFPQGGTFCEHTHTLYLHPSKKLSCLGKHIVTLACASEGPLRCALDPTVPVHINGRRLNPNVYSVSLAPFDYRIEMGAGTTVARPCDMFVEDYFYGNSSLRVGPFAASSQSIERIGKEIVPPLKSEARLPRNVLYCEQAHMDADSIAVGLLQSGVSFYYRPETNTVEIYTTRPNTMKNTWEDVIVLNLCLLCLMHFFADRAKDVTATWTLAPEIFGIGSAFVGIMLQNSDSGVYQRVADIDGGENAVYALTASVLVQLAGHLSCLGLLFARRGKDAKKSGLPRSLEDKCQTLRRLTAECALLGSIFLQVLSGSQTMFDSYVGFMAGFVLVYNGTYRTFETVVGSEEVWKARNQHTPNHPAISLAAMCTLAVSAWTFYVVGAAPSIDPVSGLSEHITEVSSLVLTVAFSFGGVGLAYQYQYV